MHAEPNQKQHVGDKIPAILVAHCRTLQVLYANHDACDLFGFDDRELRNLTIPYLLVDHKNLAEAKDNALQGGSTGAYHMARHKNGTFVPVHSQHAALDNLATPVKLYVLHSARWRPSP